jgi:DNA-binding transcriptional LysR family regulator
MDRFIEMEAFNAVVDSGSFVKAADNLNTSKAAVSRYVSDLETRLGVRLLHRTTRKLSLTDEGQIFFLRSKELLSELNNAELEITSRNDVASGLIRINTPVTFGIKHLSPLWGKFLERYPEIKLEITLADRIVDLVEEGYDVAIRIANLASSNLISKKLSATRLILCASPAYLKKHGIPQHPDELAHHATIAYSLFSTKDEWHFDGPEGQISVKTNPRIHSNNGDTCRAVALNGMGIILQPSFLISEDIQSGALIELMPQYKSIELGIYAIYASRKHLAPKIRVLIDFLAENLKNT